MCRCHSVSCIVVLGCFLVASSIGCTPLDLNMKMPWQEEETEYQMPQRIVGFWSDTVLYQKGAAAIRGFGGRIFFYTGKGKDPIEVDGSLVVYAFDADQHDPSNQKPEKKFVFTDEQLRQHYSRSKVGHSYSIWLPWDEVGGPTRNISLVIRFEGREGGAMVSDPVSKLLPGSGTPDRMQVQNRSESLLDPNDFPVQPASHHDFRDAELRTSQRHLPTDTINLPSGFTRHLRRANPDDNSGTQPDSKPTDSRNLSTDPEHPSPPQTNQQSLRGNVTSLSRSAHESFAGVEQPENPSFGEVADSPSNRFESTRFPARRKSPSGLGRDPLRRGPHPAGWPSSLPPTPRYDWRQKSQVNQPTGPGDYPPTPSP